MVDNSKIRRYRVARGSWDGDNARKIAVRFDQDVFHKVLDVALKNNRCFGEQVRLYVEAGMKREK